jgi:hypothetical protein
MNSHNRRRNRQNEAHLEGVIEPLASYICATDRPQATLKLALALLMREVELTNRAARARVVALLEKRLALPA